MTRPDWEDYFLGIARAVAARGDCLRRQVGCVIVDQDHRVLATGYNGTHPGGPSCLAGDCPRALSDVPSGTGDYDLCIGTHAESNALLFARASVKGADLYCTDAPCPGCSKLIRSAGILTVTFPARKGAPEWAQLALF